MVKFSVTVPVSARSGARFTGVIDTLSAGYSVVNQRPWLLVLPILLDLFLWLGPRLSVGRLVGRTLSRTLPLGPNGAAAALMDEAQQRELVELAEGINLLAALAPSPLGLPSFVATLGVRDPLSSVAIQSWGEALLILAGATLGGMLLGAFYYAVLAQAVRDGRVSPARQPSLAVRAWGRVLLYLLLVIGVALLFGLPIGVLTAGAALLSPALASLVLSAVSVGVIWAGIYLFFVPEAIFLSGVGPLRAVKQSVAVVRLSFWPTLGLIGLTTLVLFGLGQVWELASERLTEPWGLAVGVLGNAYIASGLIAASMRFYRERIEYLGASGQWSVVSGQQPDPLTTDHS
jgi:hypothetical protein